MQPFLSIVIPAYNEERRIGASLEAIKAYLASKAWRYEIVIADDGCSDNTEQVVRSILGANGPLIYLKGGQNQGKGNAVKRGMLASTGEFSLLTDADLSTPIEEFDKFLVHLTSADSVVTGTRKTIGANVTKHQAFIRENMGKCFTLFTNVILSLGQSDYTCGFKVFGQAARQRIFSAARIDRWGYDSEIFFLAKLFGFTVTEVPVVWANSEATRVNLLLDSARSFKELFEIRWNQAGGKYKVGPIRKNLC
ncbi:MAG: hypothetical protein A2268_08875 [Candidatus Raymondbacteria bacterium RifOxyA12_full_50_37]|uniref:dolichyl-phosphate beta-glucosyltransferase n=1 Tax=Candidatus Raymondbacteria bacterium RIFOXYD12_FULL_49_13 TaxID=1817890 RepID=A0A1F7FGF6_UNCRA|nr:MAG: hypothetical protein A2350_19795 [Candidatus Raymondbacteria bacterium RifOxyB12_full_50_8]OGJ91605.1 MAG: hypothetical protein A2268_08875 [Candidatus Raymondbacteria bacterium RifOxyA12_full_50_37]OGJ92911.1 MAG: hypothetical protein A2248_08575 [Candidatus Raymondbacteria bacterium RIFOXYA2_FULL_49_16]OGJ94837.1 MAG: hypothetical protein A2487_03275 [Candidatus Raymondbacteria bacterium RifOxyC12_full_50_8]OGK05703.1 MAG: hypothetical protein A2519_03895 [Candidatus Raymondbacteria b